MTDQSQSDNTLPTQELAVATPAVICSTTESAVQSMGALCCPESPRAFESSSGEEGSGEQNASVQVQGDRSKIGHGKKDANKLERIKQERGNVIVLFWPIYTVSGKKWNQ